MTNEWSSPVLVDEEQQKASVNEGIKRAPNVAFKTVLKSIIVVNDSSSTYHSYHSSSSSQRSSVEKENEFHQLTAQLSASYSCCDKYQPALLLECAYPPNE